MSKTLIAAALALCLCAAPATADVFRAGAWTIDAETRNSKISGKVSGPACKALQIEIFTTRWGHAVVQVRDVSQSRKFFDTTAAIYGRGPSPRISQVYATCQD